MTRRFTVVTLFASAMMLSDDRATAQTRQEPEWRAVVSLGLGGQVTATDFVETFTFEQFAEEGSLESRHRVGAGGLVNLGVDVRLWRDLGVGIAVAGFERATSGGVALRVPHPLIFNRDREASAQIRDMERREGSLHFKAVYRVPVGPQLSVLLSGGPSYFAVTQSVVERVSYEEAFPFEALNNLQPVATTVRDTALGFNAGADIALRLGRRWGVGGLLRYSRATANFSVPTGDRDLTVDLGGMHVSGGLRLFF
jgi:hypothetical protein